MPSLDRATVEAMLAERLGADPAFRDRLVADPRAVVSEVIGIPIPGSVVITLHEESLTDVHLTIPADPSVSDDILEQVSGGGSGTQLAAPTNW